MERVRFAGDPWYGHSTDLEQTLRVVHFAARHRRAYVGKSVHMLASPTVQPDSPEARTLSLVPQPARLCEPRPNIEPVAQQLEAFRFHTSSAGGTQ